MLHRLPRTLPGVQTLIDDIAAPAATIAKALDCDAATVRRWRRNNTAPRAAHVALFFLSKWGASEVAANAANDAAHYMSLASSLRQELELARADLMRLGERIASAQAPKAWAFSPTGYRALGLQPRTFRKRKFRPYG